MATVGRHARKINPSVRHMILSSAQQTINDDGSERFFGVFAIDSGSAGNLFAEGDLSSVTLQASSIQQEVVIDGYGGVVEVYSTSDLR